MGMTPQLARALVFLRHVVAKVPSRELQLSGATEPPTLVWTDAMFEPGKPCRLGLIVSSPRTKTPRAFTAVIPESIVLQFVPKSTHIGQAELFAALMGFASVPELYEGASIIHFVDNQSALCGLISCTSSKADSSCILGLYAVLLARCRARVWAEYVESEANVSDGVSREGLTDSMATSLGCTVETGTLPDFTDLHAAPLDALLKLFP